jgi:hypothetical protein
MKFLFFLFLSALSSVYSAFTFRSVSISKDIIVFCQKVIDGEIVFNDENEYLDRLMDLFDLKMQEKRLLTQIRTYTEVSFHKIEEMYAKLKCDSQLESIGTVARDLIYMKPNHLLDLLLKKDYEFNVFFWLLAAGEHKQLANFPPIEGLHYWYCEMFTRRENKVFKSRPTEIDYKALVRMGRETMVPLIKSLPKGKSKNSQIRIVALVAKLEAKMTEYNQKYFERDHPFADLPPFTFTEEELEWIKKKSK